MSEDRIKQTARKSTGGMAPRMQLAVKHPRPPPRMFLATKRPMRYAGNPPDSDDEDYGSDGGDEAEFDDPGAPDSTGSGTASGAALKPGAKRPSESTSDASSSNGTLNGSADAKKPKPATVTVVDLSSDEEELEDSDDEELGELEEEEGDEEDGAEEENLNDIVDE